MPKPMEIKNMRFGRLAVISQSENLNGRTMWLCKCDCGNNKLVAGKVLQNGGTRSCGCLHIEMATERCLSRAVPIGTKRIKKQNGRMLIKTERGFVQEHVHIMEQHLGHRLKKGDVVHHIDHDITNNSLSNLAVMSHGEHTRLHHTGRVVSNITRQAIARANQRHTDEEARLLRNMVASGASQKAAARQLKISPMIASRIIRGITYKEKENGLA